MELFATGATLQRWFFNDMLVDSILHGFYTRQSVLFILKLMFYGVNIKKVSYSWDFRTDIIKLV